MAKKYRAVCNSCDYRGDAFVNPVSAKNQRNKHQKDTDYQHNVGIEITEDVVTFITSQDIESGSNKARENKLL